MDIEDRWNKVRAKDRGCELHPSCLTCSREECKYDDPPANTRLSPEIRMEAIRLTMDEPAEVVAAKYGISVRYVNELRKRDRDTQRSSSK